MTSPASGEKLPGRAGLTKNARRGVWAGVAVVVLLGLILGTKVVSNDDPSIQGEARFDPQQFAEQNFPDVRQWIIDNAVDAKELADAIAQDPDAAAETYAQTASGKPVYSVTLTGTFGEGKSGIYDIDVDGISDLRVRVQTGPAINGTDLRDATGTMAFGDFSNQIEYQNAASALNAEMKAQVLDDVDTENLEGKTATVVGAFSLINPEAWLITPVGLDVQ